LIGLLTAPYWKNLERRGRFCVRMYLQERRASLTILADEPCFILRSRRLHRPHISVGRRRGLHVRVRIERVET